MGYPVVCMGFSIKRYLEVRHRKHKTLNVRRQNYNYFRILREAVPVSVFQELSNGTSSYLPDYDMYDQNLQDIVVQENSSSNLSWSLCVFSELASSCFSRLGQWCSSYPLPLERELVSSPVASSRALCSRSTLTPPANPEENHLTESCNGLLLRPTGSAGRCRQSAASGALPPSCSTAIATPSGPLSANTVQVPAAGVSTPARQTAAAAVAALKASIQSGPAVAANSNPALTYSRCVKENPVIRLENTNRRLRAEVQSMRSVESQLRNQLNHLQSENDLNRQSLSSQRQENESVAARISKLNSRSRSERANLAALEQSILEEKRLCALVEEQLSSFGPLASLEGATNATAGLTNNDQTSMIGIDKAIQTTAILPGPPDDLMTVAHHRNAVTNCLSGKVTRCAVDYSCCQRRRLLESELRSIHQQQQLVNGQAPTAAKSRVKMFNKANAVTSVIQRKSRVEVGIDPHRHSTAAGRNQVMELNANAAIVFDHSQVLVSEVTATCTSSQLQCQPVVLEADLQAASEERQRLERKLREENWMKQGLLTAYHASVKEITDLTNTLKQRDGQIGELSQKVEQFERCLSFDATDAATSGDRARTSAYRSVVGKKPSTNWWAPSSAGVLGQTGRHRVKQAGHQPLSSIQSPAFVSVSHAPSLDSGEGAGGAVFSAEDLLLLSTSASPSVYCRANTSLTGAPLPAVACANDDSANYLAHRFAQQPQATGGSFFDDFQLHMGDGDFGHTASQTATSLLTKGECAPRGPLASCNAAVSTAASSADLNSYAKLINSVPGSGATRQLATESH